MKFVGQELWLELQRSPSAWREWIEIVCKCSFAYSEASPSAWREWIEIQKEGFVLICQESPSAWREWIEMAGNTGTTYAYKKVSLRMEGVD